MSRVIGLYLVPTARQALQNQGRRNQTERRLPGAEAVAGRQPGSSDAPRRVLAAAQGTSGREDAARPVVSSVGSEIRSADQAVRRSGATSCQAQRTDCRCPGRFRDCGKMGVSGGEPEEDDLSLAGRAGPGAAAGLRVAGVGGGSRWVAMGRAALRSGPLGCGGRGGGVQPQPEGVAAGRPGGGCCHHPGKKRRRPR